MTKIRIGAFHHDALNLNGDLGNVRVLAKRFNLLGIDCEVFELNGSNFEQQLALGIDFALVGHGSQAAWASILADDPAFESSILALHDSGVAMLSVASGFEKLVEFGVFKTEIKRIPRVSEFVQFEADGLELIGYLNSDSGLEAYLKSGNTLGTLLHGPLLAKNPELANRIIAQILESRAIQLEEFELESIKRIDKIADQTRAVAREMLAN